MRRLPWNILQKKDDAVVFLPRVFFNATFFFPKVVSSGNRTRVPSLASLNYTTKPTRQSYVVRTCRKFENYCILKWVCCFFLDGIQTQSAQVRWPSMRAKPLRKICATDKWVRIYSSAVEGAANNAVYSSLYLSAHKVFQPLKWNQLHPRGAVVGRPAQQQHRWRRHHHTTTSSLCAARTGDVNVHWCFVYI